MKKSSRKNNSHWGEGFVLFCFFGVMTYFVCMPAALQKILFHANFNPDLVPAKVFKSHGPWWEDIAGCGVGGGGGGGGSAKWVGRGVSGGLVNLESKVSYNQSSSNQGMTLTNRISYPFLNKNEIGVTLPISYKSGTYQFRSDAQAIKNNAAVSGIGDIGLDASRKFGEIESWSLSLAATLPTGNHKIRKPYNEPLLTGQTLDGLFYLPPELQLGTGLASVTFGCDYSMDKDWGPILMGVSYTSMVGKIGDFTKTGAQNYLYKPTEGPYVDFRGQTGYPIQNLYASKSVTDSLGKLKGDFFGNSLGTSLAAGYKTERFVHSLQGTYSYKLAPDWHVRAETPRIKIVPTDINGDAVPDAGNYYLPAAVNDSRNSFGLSYGLEYSSLYYPLFFGLTSSFSTSAFQGISALLGVKGSFF